MLCSLLFACFRFILLFDSNASICLGFAEPNDRFIIARLGWLRNRGKFRVFFFSRSHNTSDSGAINLILTQRDDSSVPSCCGLQALKCRKIGFFVWESRWGWVG